MYWVYILTRSIGTISSLKRSFQGDLVNLIQTLLENTDSGVLIFNQNDKIIYINQPGQKMINLTPSEENGKDFMETLSKRLLASLESNYSDAKNYLENVSFDSIPFMFGTNFTSISGKLVPLELKGKFKGMVCFLENLLKSKEIQKRKDINFEQLFERSPYSIIITDIKGNIVDCNQAAEKLLGSNKKELLDFNIFGLDVYVENSADILYGEFAKFLIIGHKNDPLEIKIRNKEDQIIWVELVAEFIQQKDNTYIIAILKEISDRKLMELEIQHSERKYRQLSTQYETFLEVISDPIFVLDKNLKYQLINSAGCKTVQMSEEELLHKKITDLFPGIKDTEYYKTYMKALRTKEKQTIINDFTRPNGQTNYYEVRVYPIPEGILCIARDITKLNLIKSQLNESEQKFRTIAEQSLLGISIIQNNQVKYMNKTYANMYGYSIEEMMRWTLEDAKKAIHPNDRDFVIKQMIKKQRGKKNVKTHYQYRAIKKDGSLIWIDNYSKPIKYKGKPANLVTIVNITKQKKIGEKFRYQAELVENVSDAVISTDEYFNILSWNEAAEKIYGWKENEVLGKTVDQVLHTKYFNSTEDQVIVQVRRQGVWKGEVIQTHKDGSNIHILSSVNLFKDKFTGKPRVVANNKDITQRKEAEHKLRESEAKFRTITEQTIIGVHIIKNLKMVYFNKALLNIYDIQATSLENWTLREFLQTIHPQDLSKVLERLKIIIRDKKGNNYIRYSCRIQTHKGAVKWIQVISKLIEYQGERAILSTIIDISNIKKAEQKLKSLNTMKSQLLRRTSHELKTPLVSIKGFSDLILQFHSKQLDEETKKYVEEIKRGCLRLEELVKDILKTAELESRDAVKNKENGNLGKIIESTLQELSSIAKMRNIEVRLKLASDLYVKFNKEEIHLAVENLLLNAIKYTPPGGEINISAQKKERYILVSIRDTGIGFTREEKNRIFQKFGKIERYGKGYVLDSEGTGLGLFISKRIIELHGGKIWLTSKGRDRGSTFYFTLPTLPQKSK